MPPASATERDRCRAGRGDGDRLRAMGRPGPGGRGQGRPGGAVLVAIGARARKIRRARSGHAPKACAGASELRAIGARAADGGQRSRRRKIARELEVETCAPGRRHGAAGAGMGAIGAELLAVTANTGRHGGRGCDRHVRRDVAEVGAIAPRRRRGRDMRAYRQDALPDPEIESVASPVRRASHTGFRQR
jgi:hypothetical protein